MLSDPLPGSAPVRCGGSPRAPRRWRCSPAARYRHGPTAEKRPASSLAAAIDAHRRLGAGEGQRVVRGEAHGADRLAVGMAIQHDAAAFLGQRLGDAVQQRQEVRLDAGAAGAEHAAALDADGQALRVAIHHHQVLRGFPGARKVAHPLDQVGPRGGWRRRWRRGGTGGAVRSMAGGAPGGRLARRVCMSSPAAFTLSDSQTQPKASSAMASAPATQAGMLRRGPRCGASTPRQCGESSRSQLPRSGHQKLVEPLPDPIQLRMAARRQPVAALEAERQAEVADLQRRQVAAGSFCMPVSRSKKRSPLRTS